MDTYENDKLLRLFAFLIGIFSSTNVMYCFTIGTTNIMWSTVVSVICVVYCTIKIYDFQIVNVFWYSPLSFLLFYICILASIIPTLLFSIDYIMRWINGIISCVLLLITVTAVYILRKQIGTLFLGIEIGILLNGIMISYEWIQYSRGVIYRSPLIARLFPNSVIKGASIYNAFRGQGFFLEPGHLARFLALYVIILFGWYFYCNRYNAYFILFIGTILLVTTRSATAVFFVCGIGFLFCGYSKENAKLIVWTFLGACVAVAVMLLIIRDNEKYAQLFETLFSSFNDLETAISGGDSSAVIRQKGMLYAVQLIFKYPFVGVGWNNFTTHMMLEGYYSDSVKGGYSAALQMIAMLGVGSIPFFHLIVFNAISMIQSAPLFLKCMGISLFIYFIIFFTTDCGYSEPIALLFGIMICYINIDESSVLCDAERSNT